MTPRQLTAEEFAASVIITEISKHGGLHKGPAAKVADKIVERLKDKGITLQFKQQPVRFGVKEVRR